MTSSAPLYDALVIGAGFGGLGAALSLAEAGASVAICEALAYPGGCASTFSRRGASYEAGATLFSGFGPGQLFDTWVKRHGLDVVFEPLDPVITLRAPGLSLPIPRERAALVAQLAALPGAPVAKIHAFFAEQRAVADLLWALFDDPRMLPPWSASALMAHLARLPRCLPLLRLIGRPLQSALVRHGLEGFAPLRVWLDAVCQITVQASAAEAEAPFAFAAMDYPFRGTGHVHNGIGQLAWGLLRAVEGLGGAVHLASRATGLRRVGDLWEADLRGQTVRARTVLANVLPQALRTLVGGAAEPAPSLAALEARVAEGWGAVMLYLLVRELPPSAPFHLELVQDPALPFTDGNHLFASVSGSEEQRAPAGLRTVTVSTHVAATALSRLPPAEQAARVAAVQAEMQRGLARLAPELWERRAGLMTASPRTFARFTRRPAGLVGGVPRRAGLWSYAPAGLRPCEPYPDLFLVGDSVFPGQSTLAAALGGQRAATRALARLGARPAALALPADRAA